MTRPRIAVFRSNRNLYVQVIDDLIAKTIVSVNEKELILKDKKVVKSQKAHLLGLLLANKLKKLKIEKAIFDRRHYKYHGRVKQLAEGVREGGITI